MTRLCDCERGANGLGIMVRPCDCGDATPARSPSPPACAGSSGTPTDTREITGHPEGQDEAPDGICGRMYDADPNCQHDIEELWSGIKCRKCPGWFCY